MVGICYYISFEVLNKGTILTSEARKIAIYLFSALLHLLDFFDYS